MTEPTATPDRVLLDLSPADVHTPAVIGESAPKGKRSAAIVLVMEEWGSVLTVSRPEPPHEMSIPGGEIEEGETPERAAARELLEETGVSVHDLVEVAKIKSPTDGRDVHVFRAGRWTGCAAPLEPNTKVCWLGVRALLGQSMLFRASIEQLINAGVFGEKHLLSITAAKRKSLPTKEFALPSQRKYPLDTAARTRNAAARLEQMKKRGKVSDAEYKQAKARIASAAKKFGIESEYNAADDDAMHGNATPKGALHVRADLAPGGSLHVRHHMSDRPFYDGEGILLTAESAGDENKPVWNQIAKTGAFAGHPSGPFELNVKVFREVIANFKATTNRRIPVDYEHASEADETQGSIPTSGAPAQGWVTDLKVDGDNLWGLFEWLPQARDQVRTGSYRYLSPAIRFGSKDRVSGKPIGARLTSVALTNKPFLDGMQPLAARDQAASTSTETTVTLAAGKGLDRLVHATHETMPNVKKALRLHELATPQECSDHLDKLRDCCMTAGPDGSFQGTDLSAYTSALRELVGATPGMTWDDVFDCVQDMIDAAIEEHEAVYHAGASQTASDASSEEDTTMTDAALATKLTDAQTKISGLEAEKTTIETKVAGLETEKQTLLTENSTLTLSLKNEQARANAAEDQLKVAGTTIVLKDGETLLVAITRILDENKTLLADKAKRDEAELDAEVEAAFETYKTARKLSDSDRAHMKRIAKADREAFRGMYKPVAASDRHLLRDLTPPEPRPAESQAVVLTLNDLTLKIMGERKCSFSEAQILASEQLGAR